MPPNVLLIMTDDQGYQVPFRFTGKLSKVTFKLGPVQLSAADQKFIAERLAPAKN